MSRGAHVRDTIELLCRILKENGVSEIEAETIRKAKFDMPEACAPLWRLLFELLFFCQHGLMDSGVFTCFINLRTENQVAYVKQELQKRGYLSRAFGALSPGMEGGSRELLLALGWLLARESILMRFMEHRSSPVSEDVLSLYQDAGSDEAWKGPAFGEKATSSVQQVQQMLVLNNKLKMNLRLLHAAQLHYANLTHKIHDSTYGVSLSPHTQHLTSMQVYMLRHPTHMAKVLQLLEEDSQRLENLLKWEEKSYVFWEWMESVLEIKRQQMTSADAPGAEDELESDVSCTPTVFLDVPPNIGADIASCRRNLMNKILHYESALNNLEELWASKCGAVPEWELDHLLFSINAEICQLQARLGQAPPTNPSLRPAPDPASRFTLRKKQPGAQGAPRVSNLVMAGRQDNDFLVDARMIQDEIGHMQEEAGRLERELLAMRGQCLQTLMAMVTAVPNTVCILPPHLRSLNT